MPDIASLNISNPENEETKGPAAPMGIAAEIMHKEEEKLTAMQLMNPNKDTTRIVRNFNINNLETFQKYKILGDKNQAAMLKKIFVNYVCVGDNIFSTTCHDDKIDFETKSFFFGRKFTILI